MSHEKKNKEIPLAIRELIIQKWGKGLNYRQIEKDLGTNFTTVSKIIKRFKETNIIENKKGRRLKPILSPSEKRILLIEVR